MDKIAVTGSFDPVTLGHIDVINYALDTADSVYIVVLINPDKAGLFEMSERKHLIEEAVAYAGNRVKVFTYSGLAVDFCRENGIKYIARGVRNADDFVYEKEMAEWNKQHGGVYTVLFPSRRNVSSTGVRMKIANNQSLEGDVPDGVINKLTLRRM